jgi:hypothetical protein
LTVYSFDSFDEAQAFMAAQREAAIARMAPWQKAIKRGDHWMRLVEEPIGLIAIFGHVLSDTELEQGEKQAGVSQAEWEYTKRQLDASLANGYLYSMCFSIIEPDGELGSVHASGVFPITHDEFAKAMRRGWTPGPWLMELRDAIVKRIDEFKG